MRTILILLLAGSCLAGTRYEGADSTDGRYWECEPCWETAANGFVLTASTCCTPRPEAWELSSVDTCGWKWPVSQTVRITKDGCVNLASLIVADTCLDLPVPLLDSIYAPKYLLLEGPDGPTWITAAQRKRLLRLFDSPQWGDTIAPQWGNTLTSDDDSALCGKRYVDGYELSDSLPGTDSALTWGAESWRDKVDRNRERINGLWHSGPLSQALIYGSPNSLILVDTLCPPERTAEPRRKRLLWLLNQIMDSLRDEVMQRLSYPTLVIYR